MRRGRGCVEREGAEVLEFGRVWVVGSESGVFEEGGEGGSGERGVPGGLGGGVVGGVPADGVGLVSVADEAEGGGGGAASYREVASQSPLGPDVTDQCSWRLSAYRQAVCSVDVETPSTACLAPRHQGPQTPIARPTAERHCAVSLCSRHEILPVARQMYEVVPGVPGQGSVRVRAVCRGRGQGERRSPVATA